MNNDLISRAAAFDSVEIFLKQTDAPEVYPGLIPALARVINNVPSAQPEIIRCKDCKYCDRGIDEAGNPFLKCLGWVYGGTQEEDFCSHAERRTDGRD